MSDDRVIPQERVWGAADGDRFVTEGDLIEVPDLPSLMRFSALRETGLNRTLSEVEAEYIRNVLASVDGNRTRAAGILGIDRKTLREKLRKIEIKPLPSSKD